MPGCLGVINSEARALFGPTSTVIIKPCTKEEATILAQLIAHQALLHLGADRTRAAGTSPGGTCHGSAGDTFAVMQQTVLFVAVALEVRTVFYISLSTRLTGCSFTPLVNAVLLSLCLCPNAVAERCCVMVWSRVFQVAVLCDVHGLLLLPAAGRNLFCD